MNKTIEQTVIFKGATAAQLYEIYVDPKKHAMLHGGAETHISAKEGAVFSLLNGNLTGKNLLVVPNKMIVQSWRGNVWKENDSDSILTLIFHDTKDGAKLMMTHSFTPKAFIERWAEAYWEPMKKLLRKS